MEKAPPVTRSLTDGHSRMDTELLRTIRMIRGARSLEGLADIIQAALLPYDLTDFMVSVVQQPGVESSETIPLSNIDGNFVRWYLANDGFLIDPRVAISQRRLEAFIWSEAIDLSQHPITVKRLYARFAEAGMADAINISVRSLAGLEGTVLFGGQSVELNAQQRGNLTVLGIALHEQVRVIEQQPNSRPSHVRLSQHVREVLRLGALGFTSRQIAERRGLTKRTVDMHFDDAAKVLGSSTRIQAVSRAFRLNLFTVDG